MRCCAGFFMGYSLLFLDDLSIPFRGTEESAFVSESGRPLEEGLITFGVIQVALTRDPELYRQLRSSISKEPGLVY